MILRALLKIVATPCHLVGFALLTPLYLFFLTRNRMPKEMFNFPIYAVMHWWNYINSDDDLMIYSMGIVFIYTCRSINEFRVNERFTSQYLKAVEKDLKR